MARQTKTAFSSYVARRRKDPEFETAYQEARQEIEVVDQLIRALDEARIQSGFSKAELARQIGSKPEVLRRLFSDERANPTLKTLVSLASALNLRLELIPGSKTGNAA